MSKGLILLLTIQLIIYPLLTSCGPSKAELEYEEYLKAYEETQQRLKAEQKAQKDKELADIRNWCIEVAVIIKKDSNIVASWKIFQENSANISLFSSWEVKEHQERKFMEYMEYYETLT